ncbi:DNA (cytosine-5-)-methyltransferase [Desulfuribacillus alkaliarsenatis]|uniref:Cytosine-specific methyltransferase n=1 Tax=Desulfuribacillus alkaliarsenatis TaxID=766136 RepID=A0A1E5G2T1_9FIRM|nr:DNA (cytosine-5-)-methyltransferase [Desulfuribacillus alkaliarsenatis]OEF97382.1 DNA (cytosine-5-)-methyltransferase [Desulfuribacillus alkaliarsenatis]
MEKSVVELFAGVGGFRLGLGQASEEFKFVWANQWEPSRKAQDAYECYISHFGNSDIHSNEDINKVDKNDIPQHSVLVGGFPCQDYSVARTGAQGIKGKKGVLWWDIYEILKAKTPPFVILENVDRLLKSPSSQRGKDFGVILGCFKELDYSVEWRVINAADYGFPQRRRRIFIFAYKNNTSYAKGLKEYNLNEIIEHTGFFQQGFPAEPISLELSNKSKSTFDFIFEDLIEVSDNFTLEFSNAGIMRGNEIHTQQLCASECYTVEQQTLKDILESNVDERYYLNGELDDWLYMKGPKRIERTNKNGHKYIFAEGGIAFPDPVDKPARTMLTSESSKNRSTHIIEDPLTGRKRKLTPIECERLNGFPDNWTNTGMSERFRYFCMGNALVVGLIEKMGITLSEIIDGETSSSSEKEDQLTAVS